MAPEPVWTACVINLAYQCVFFYMYVARQGLGKSVTAAANTLIRVEELFDASSSMRYVSYQGKVSELFFPELLLGALEHCERIVIKTVNKLSSFVVYKVLKIWLKFGFESKLGLLLPSLLELEFSSDGAVPPYCLIAALCFWCWLLSK
jgi:hypothetical protein